MGKTKKKSTWKGNNKTKKNSKNRSSGAVRNNERATNKIVPGQTSKSVLLSDSNRSFDEELVKLHERRMAGALTKARSETKKPREKTIKVAAPTFSFTSQTGGTCDNLVGQLLLGESDNNNDMGIASGETTSLVSFPVSKRNTEAKRQRSLNRFRHLELDDDSDNEFGEINQRLKLSVKPPTFRMSPLTGISKQ